MPLLQGKMCQEEESDSDESFHCCGRPEDLLEDAQLRMEIPKPVGNEVRVPEDQDYYLYSAGLGRLNSPNDGPNCGSLSSSHDFQRTLTVCSSDSDRTRVGSPLLIIKTGEVVLPASALEMRHIPVQSGKPSLPAKPRKKPQWKIQIRPPHSFLRMAISPTEDPANSQASDSPSLSPSWSITTKTVSSSRGNGFQSQQPSCAIEGIGRD
ncbi:hypothetical protein PtA15_9A79 [Puccinia triticina]|uniref:Uncharacterized protein n=1 Tax=Puccinia triticina TaxID=208348 RepID=A0ABY7CSF3_9BASI|nr:uncharacterized protein PtA15_9A79 [Puccinia triticina]WAQ87955.1 hypothetical protein PtA15_9A79 [Puccinia triticina]WAR60145.1 hypothetical protein PtB15_9B82 [Puccinia triticina]